MENNFTLLWVLYHAIFAIGTAILGWLLGKNWFKSRFDKAEVELDKNKQALKLLKKEYLTYEKKFKQLDLNYASLNNDYIRKTANKENTKIVSNKIDAKKK